MIYFQGMVQHNVLIKAIYGDSHSLLISKNDIDTLAACIMQNSQFIMGPEVQELEGVGRLCRCASLLFSSGTVSLEILRALGIGPGDEVITVPFTWISTAEVITVQPNPCLWTSTPPPTTWIHRSGGGHPAYQAILPVVFGQMPDFGNQCYCRQAWLARHRGCRPALEHPGGSTQLRGLVDWEYQLFSCQTLWMFWGWRCLVHE